MRHAPGGECLLDGAVDLPLEREIRVAHAVEARVSDDRHLEERVVRRRPAPDEPLQDGFRRNARECPSHVTEVVEDRAIAEDDVRLGFGLKLPGDLRMEDPGLSLEGRLPIDRQRTLARDLPDELDGQVPFLEGRRQVVAEGGFSHTVCADERDFHPGRRISALCGSSRGGLRGAPGPSSGAPDQGRNVDRRGRRT